MSDRRAAAYLSLSSSTRSRSPRSQSLHRRQASYFPCLIHPVRISLYASATPGNSDTEQPLSYCYELPTQLRLESVANAHTAADLHVRSWVSYRAGQESLERRERVTNTPSAISDNPLIRRRGPTLRLCCNTAIAKLHTKFLNQRAESRGANKRDSFRRTRKIF